jgi:hypothetical protein
MSFTDRQKKAQALAEELQGLPNVWILNSMPLPESQDFLVQTLTSGRTKVFQILKELGYGAQLRSCMPRITPNGFEASESYAIDLSDRLPIPADDREPPVEVVKEATAAQKAEVAAMKEAIFGRDHK